MPLAFHSLSHGEVAFGFFNIDTDMLLLDIHFFFADDFCGAVKRLAQGAGAMHARPRLVNGQTGNGSAAPSTIRLGSYTLDRSRIGNLMGAIHGIELRGFIGEVYQRFPFPREEGKFRQQPEGWRNRQVIETIVAKYAEPRPIGITFDPVENWIDIGGYVFEQREFLRLVLYVWVGGYPRWREGIRPPYVVEMKDVIESSPEPLFAGLDFDDD